MISTEAIVFLTALVIVAFLVWLLSLILSSVNQCNPNNTTAADDEGGTPANFQAQPQRHQAISAVADAIHAYRRARHTHEHQSNKRTKQANAILGATALFALIAAIAATISGWLFYGQLEEMRLDKRAWVYAQSTWINNNITSDGDIINIPLSFRLTNVGHSPALRVLPFAKASLQGGIGPVDAKEVCDAAEKSFMISLTIFPNDFAEQGIPAATAKGELAAVREQADKFNSGRSPVLPTITVCIAYRFTPDGTFHHTPMGFFLQRRDEKSFTAGDFPIKPSDIYLIRSPNDIGAAD